MTKISKPLLLAGTLLALGGALVSMPAQAQPVRTADASVEAEQAALSAGNPSGAAEPGAAVPNVMLIILDDVGLDLTTGMYPGLIESLSRQYGPEGLDHPDYGKIAGHPASTPVLDSFATQGMVFTNAWAEPFCSPTRAAILTGLSTPKMHVRTYADALATHHTSFVSLLKDNGYATGVFGKWHMAGLPGAPVDYPGMKPFQAGFDIFRGNLHAAPLTYWSYDYEIQDETTGPDEWLTVPAPERSLPGIPATTYAPIVKAADTIDWITAQETAQPERPWFTWLAFNLAHATISSDPTQMIVPDANTLDEATRAEMEACGGHFGTADPGNCTGEQMARAMTNSMDTVIGKVIEAVDNLDPNTYVIVISDNGTPMYGRPGLDFIDNMYITRSGRGKGTAYESGLRVGMAVRGPGVAAGSSSDEFVHAFDLFSTILGLAGVSSPEMVPDASGEGLVSIDSVSLSPILFGEADTVRDPLHDTLVTETVNLMTKGTLHAGVRNKTHKLVCIGGTGAENCQFYDLTSDPLEEYALAIPASCEADAQGNRTPADDDWHYCVLSEAMQEAVQQGS
tara:strand:- start:45740 stop:47440 length:1701 start_codon:yes stop_codon:yes gene_type:complete